MDVDSKGFVYIGQDTVRKHDRKSGKLVGEIAARPENEGGGGGGGRVRPRAPQARAAPGPSPASSPCPAGRARSAAIPRRRPSRPPRGGVPQEVSADTPMIVGGLEEIRIDEGANEMYAADNYLGGRVMVFDLNTLAFKRGWGAYGKPLSQISTDDATREYKPGGPMAKDFVGHLTLNFSNDGLVYAADRVGNRIHVTDKQGKFVKEFPLAVNTGVGGAPGGVGFSPDKEQRYLFISDLTNNHIWFLNRADGKVVGQLGSMGDNGGQFFGLHMIAVDSTGNIYTGEVFAGERVQRFVPANSARGKLLSQLATMK